MTNEFLHFVHELAYVNLVNRKNKTIEMCQGTILGHLGSDHDMFVCMNDQDQDDDQIGGELFTGECTSQLAHKAWPIEKTDRSWPPSCHQMCLSIETSGEVDNDQNQNEPLSQMALDNKMKYPWLEDTD